MILNLDFVIMNKNDSFSRDSQFFSYEGLEALATSLVVANVSQSHFHFSRGATAGPSVTAMTDNFVVCVFTYVCVLVGKRRITLGVILRAL